MALAVGARLGHYTVTALIGEGGHGSGLSSHRHQADPSSLREIVGEPVPVEEGVQTKASGAANVDVSENGSLVYVPAPAEGSLRTMVWVSPDGVEEALSADPALYESPRISPDGRYVAVEVDSGVDSGNPDIVIHDLQTETTTLLGLPESRDAYPLWTPDGRNVVFSSRRGGSVDLYSASADGTGEVERVTTVTMSSYIRSPGQWTAVR